MRKICILKNKIQDYPWGSKTGIAEIMGTEIPSKEPQAELWMGAHPKAPSEVFLDNEWHSLLDLINQSPREILGINVVKKFGSHLPFLFKILAASQPLSIQAHPNLQEAKEGFARENKRGIPLDGWMRTYRDENHKPEIICALTSFWALNGFQPVGKILKLLSEIPSNGIESLRLILENDPNPKGLRDALKFLFTLNPKIVRQTVKETVAYAINRLKEDSVYHWIVSANDHFPGDVGVLCIPFLNLVHLKPGQAMFLPAGRLHAYLEGVGVELMANSDNVLRGGLTSKYKNIDELLNILDFSETGINILGPTSLPQGEGVFTTPAVEFHLSKISLSKEKNYRSQQNRNVEILICTNGNGSLTVLDDDTHLDLLKGVSVVIPASVNPYRIQGNLVLYKATVPNEGLL